MNRNLEIIEQVRGRLTRDVRVNLNAGEVEFDCEDGNLTLSGTVPTVAAKKVAVRLAGEVPGVRTVRDRLHVAVIEPMGDLELATHIRHAFIQERNIEEEQIEITADPDGEVVLRGHVHSLAQHRLCEVLCWWVPGVTAVRNLIEVQPPEEDSDEELRDNLLTILGKDVLVDPTKFRLDVHDRVVTLRGRVDRPTEKDAAESDCWFTPGVTDVINELRVG